MSRSLVRILVLVITSSIFSLLPASQSEAKDLTDVLGVLDINLSTGERLPIGDLISPAFAGAIAQAVAQQIPLASVAPAFTYRYNPAVDTFERSTSVPGPLFSERAMTLGNGQLNFGVGYSFIDFSELNGTDLDNIRDPGIVPTFDIREAVPQEITPPGFPPSESGQSLFFAPLFTSVGRNRLTLQAHIVVPTLRYGLTDRWDIGLSIPIMNTFLRVRRERLAVVEAPNHRFAFVLDAQGSLLNAYYADLKGNPVPITQVAFIKSQRSGVSLTQAGNATGVGDITLRSKYQFWRTEEGGAALGLVLQLPTGEKRNFHGTEETHLSTFLYLSQVMQGWVEPHLNVGVDFNAEDVDRSSFLWAVGGTLLVGKKLGFVVDFIGRSDFAKFPVHFPPSAITSGNVLNRAPDTCTTTQPCQLKPSEEDPDEPKPVFFPFFPEKIKRNDIINFSFGLRYALGESGSIFFGGTVPLNDDGFRADFIPSGGIEYTF